MMLCDEVETGKRVALYRNLHFPKVMWSVKSMDSSHEDRDYGLVVAHVPSAIISNCSFHVSAAGRGRVLSTKNKNVHASVRGFWGEELAAHAEGCGTAVTYNPYKYGSFVTVDGEHPVASAELVLFGSGGLLAWGLTYAEGAGPWGTAPRRVDL